MVKSLKLGLKRDWRQLLGGAFLAYSAIWTVLESFDRFFSGRIPTGWKYYGALIVVAIAVGLIRILPKRSVTFEVPGTATEVRVFFGDIFSQEGYLAIPVNEYFDSEVGQQVAGTSLHGMVIGR
ncbi:MAG: macro domain-containing protein, partial [Planctomycetota bacterium]